MCSFKIWNEFVFMVFRLKGSIIVIHPRARIPSLSQALPTLLIIPMVSLKAQESYSKLVVGPFFFLYSLGCYP